MRLHSTPAPYDVEWPSEEERLLLAWSCKESLWNFIRIAFGGHWNPRINRWLDRDVTLPMVQWFEHHALEWLSWRGTGRQKHLMLIVPREFGKTTLITKASLLWLHLHDPDLSTYIGSETVARAHEFLATVKSVMSGEDEYARFTWLYGDWCTGSRRWNAMEAEHTFRKARSRSEPSFGTWGIERGLTGTHPDVLCLDDPISYEAMEGDVEWLHQVNDHIDSLVPVLTADGMMILPGTRYHDNDHFGRLLRTDGASSVSGMPCDITPRDDGLWDVYFLQGRHADGTPTFPRQWSVERLRDYERKNNVRYWAQIMNQPHHHAFVPIGPEQVSTMYVDPIEVPRDLMYSLHCDTSFKRSENIRAGLSESVVELWGHNVRTGVVYYIEGYGGDRWKADDFRDVLVALCKKLQDGRTYFADIPGRHPYIITDEWEAGGAKQGAWELAMESWLKQAGVAPPEIAPLSRSKRGKTQRLIEAATHWTDGRVRLVRGAPGLHHLVSQMCRIGTSQMTDWADAGADVFHPRCYNSPALQLPTTQPKITRVWDEVLRHFEEPDRAPYDPV